MDERRILIVEDETAQAEALKNALEHAGYAITLAVNGREGAEKVHELLPNLVVLDLMLPITSGADVLAKINRETSLQHIPVLVLTNLAQDARTKELMNAQKDFYMTKTNHSLKEIVEKINTIFSLKKSSERMVH